MNRSVFAPSIIAGPATYLPTTRVGNDTFNHFGIDSDWIVDRTGIKERRVASLKESTSVMAAAAGQAALRRSALRPEDIDAVIVATCTPDQPVPSTAAIVAADLGIEGAVFDVGAACAGFVYAIVTACGLVRPGGARCALVIGADSMSRLVDPTDRGTAILFGDGAGAVVVSQAPSSDHSLGMLGWDFGSSRAGRHLLEVKRPSPYLRMDGPAVFRCAVRSLAGSIEAVLGACRVSPGDVDLLVPHQANARILEAVCRQVGIGIGRTVMTIDRYGNTSSASIPLGLADAERRHQLKPGSLVLLAACGSGMTWGTALLRWGNEHGGLNKQLTKELTTHDA